MPITRPQRQLQSPFSSKRTVVVLVTVLIYLCLTTVTLGEYKTALKKSSSPSNAFSKRHFLQELPDFSDTSNGRYFVERKNGNKVLLTPLLELQEYLEELIAKVKAPHVAIVAMQPHTGRILGIAGKSKSVKNITTHSGFPAASLFKIITAGAAMYDASITADSKIIFRGGNYTLNKYNYLPSKRYDKRNMTVGEAMGKSCNPVFGRLALQLRSPASLRDLAHIYRFGSPLGSDFPLSKSTAIIPNGRYELSRTAAGFGKVYISPVHAAALMASIANDGKMPTPHLVHNIVSEKGVTLGYVPPSPHKVLDKAIADELLRMTSATTVTGTAKNAFRDKRGTALLPFGVAGKTGTLRGKNPKGLTKWFIAAAPLPEPRLVLAIVVMDPRYQRDRPTYLGKKIFERFFS